MKKGKSFILILAISAILFGIATTFWGSSPTNATGPGGCTATGIGTMTPGNMPEGFYGNGEISGVVNGYFKYQMPFYQVSC